MNELAKNPRFKSDHQQRVEEFMLKAGQDIPQSPTIPSEEVRLLRAKLILEEALETVEALGFIPYANDVTRAGGCICVKDMVFESCQDGSNIQEVVDGCCDIAVVTTGTLIAFGIADVGPQEAVDEANLAKFRGDAHRREDGKWVKPSDWQPPDWDKILAEQNLVSTKDIPVVDDSTVPVGPGDGFHKRDTDTPYYYRAYQGHLCPKCKASLSDELVKRLCAGTQGRCPECQILLITTNEEFDRPTVRAAL